jgi:hypothetical protein
MNSKTKQVFYKMKNFLIFKSVDARENLKKICIKFENIQYKKVIPLMIQCIYKSGLW